MKKWHVVYSGGRIENVVSFPTKAEAIAWADKYCSGTKHRIAYN
jgi:hypothetical protein